MRLEVRSPEEDPAESPNLVHNTASRLQCIDDLSAGLGGRRSGAERGGQPGITIVSGAGGRMIDDRGRPGSRRAMIGFIHPAALGGILVHFDAREEL